MTAKSYVVCSTACLLFQLLPSNEQGLLSAALHVSLFRPSSKLSGQWLPEGHQVSHHFSCTIQVPILGQGFLQLALIADSRLAPAFRSLLLYFPLWLDVT
jgi:hypothetical protein